MGRRLLGFRGMRSASYLKHVRSFPCLLCRRPADDAHHLRHAEGGPSGVARKVGDEWTVPLCRFCHMELHTTGDEELFWIKKRIDPEDWARISYAQWKDPKTTR